MKKAFVDYYKGIGSPGKYYTNRTGFFVSEDTINNEAIARFGIPLFKITDIDKIKQLQEWVKANPALFGVRSREHAWLGHYIDFLKKDEVEEETEAEDKVSLLTTKDLKEIPLNLILYGPPGTGKTYHTVNKALEILEPKTKWASIERKTAITQFNKYMGLGRIIFTTFHQSMSYEDFIEGIKPNLNGKDEKDVGYRIQPGIFKQIAKTAEEDRNNKYVLIIDEINRGNIANIFGELITLIEDDKRTTRLDEKGEYVDNLEGIRVKLPYSNSNEKETSTEVEEKDFGVPGNLYIIGTMNTADRSVEALDSALRRRFSFEEMMPKPNLLNTVTIEGLDKTLGDLLSTINKRIEILKDREHQIGHSYFMVFVDKDKKHTTVTPDALKSVFTDKIIPLLQEYFYGDYEKIQLVVGGGFVEEVKGTEPFAKNRPYDGIPEKRYSIVINPKMKDALLELMNI